MRGVNGIAGWRWLFALEGCLTGIIGVISWFYLPPSPTQTASKFRGKDGWFNEREEKIMVNRVLRDDPSKGDMHNRQALTPSMFWKCLKDYHMWPIYLLGLTWMYVCCRCKPRESVLQFVSHDWNAILDDFVTEVFRQVVCAAHLSTSSQTLFRTAF